MAFFKVPFLTTDPDKTDRWTDGVQWFMQSSVGRVASQLHAALVTASVQCKQTAEHQATKTVPDDYIADLKGRLRNQNMISI